MTELELVVDGGVLTSELLSGAEPESIAAVRGLTPRSPESRIRLRDGVMDDGTLVARDMAMDINVGGYDLEAFNIANSIPGGMLGSYDVPAVG